MSRMILFLALMAPPALADDLPGAALYQDHCLDCHLADGSGGIGADIRGMSRNRVARAIKGFDEMPQIPLTEAEIDAIVAYLATLRAE